MPSSGELLLLLIAGVLIQQSASPTYAQTNFALNQETIVSSNDTCGLQGKDEFCFAVDRFHRCQKFDYCDADCPFGRNELVSVDIVATGMFHGQVNLFANQSSGLCHKQVLTTVQFNGANGFISKSTEILSLFRESEGMTLTIHLSQYPGDKGKIISKEDNSSVHFVLSADSTTDHQIVLEYMSASGLSSSLLINNSLADEKCHHVAVVLFGSVIQLFIDTELVAEEITYKNLWDRSGIILLGGRPNASQDDYFKGELGSYLYVGTLLPSEIKTDALGKTPHKPRLAAHCRCNVDYPKVSMDPDGLFCVNPKNNNTVRRVNNKAHFEGMANDGNLSTWWQSKGTRVPLNFTVSLGGVKQVLVVRISFKWWPPKDLVLSKSADYGETWLPWQYFSQECETTFNMEAEGRLDSPDSVNCVERFSHPVPHETVTFYLLQSSRPASNTFETNQTLQDFSFATHVRLTMMSFLGNSAEKTDYFAISELEVFGRNCSCLLPVNSTCVCDGAITRPPNCIETVIFDSDFYKRSIFDETPLEVSILQVYARSLCSGYLPVSYFIVERNDSQSFQIENTTGIFKLRSYVALNSTFRFLVGARLQGGAEHQVNSSKTIVLIKVITRATLESRTVVNFETQKLGFLQGRTSNRVRQLGFFVNDFPGSEGSVRAFVGKVSAEANYSTTREPATHVKAMLVSADVYWDRPVVRVIAQVQDSSFNVRTLVDESKVVVKVDPSAKLLAIDGSLLLSVAKPSASTGIAEIQVPLPSKWFLDPSLFDPEVLTITYRLLNSAKSPTFLGNVTVHPGSKTRLFSNDVYGMLPFETVYIGGVFSFPIYCDSSYAVASFGIRIVIGPSLVITGVQVDSQRWAHVAVNHSSFEWVVSATLTDPEAAPQGFVKKVKLVSVDIKVQDTAVINASANATVTAEVTYLSNINNEEIEIGGQLHPIKVAMLDGFNQSRHTIGMIRLSANGVKELRAYAESADLVNTAVMDGRIVTANIALLAIQRSGDVILLPEANCTSLSEAVQVTKNCSNVFLNGSEPEGSAEAQVKVQFGQINTIVSVRVWFPVLPMNLTLFHSELAAVSGWLQFNAYSGKCDQRYQWTRVESEAQFTYDKVHFENISTTSLVRDLLISANESIATVDNLGNVYGMSPGQTVIRAVNPLTGNFLGSTEVKVTALRRVAVQLIDVVMVTNLSVIIPDPPYPRLSTQMAEAFVHQDLRRDHARGALVAFVTFEDGRRQKLNSALGLQLKSLEIHVLRITGQSEAVSVGSGSGVLQANWVLPPSRCYPNGYNLGVGYELTNISLLPPVRLEINGISPQITFPGDKSTVAGIPTSSYIAVTLVFENEHRVDMSSDSRTIYDLSKSEGFFSVQRDHNNAPVITPNSLGKSGKKDLVVRFTHFSITSSVSVNIVTYTALVLHAKPYPPYPGAPLINSLSLVADTNAHEMASLSLAMVLSDSSKYDITGHQLTSFSSRSPDVIVGQKAANRVRVKSGPTASLAFLDGKFGNVDSTDLIIFIRSSSVNVTSISNLVLLPDNNQTLSGVENSLVAQVQLSLTFDNGRLVTQFYDGNTALFPGLISLTSENNNIFTVDSSTGQVTLRRNYHQTLSLTATVAVSLVTSSLTVACNLLPAVGDVDLGEEIGLPLPPRHDGSSFQIQVRLNAGERQSVKKIDLTLTYDRSKLAVMSVRKGSVWNNCVSDLNTLGQISLDCLSDSPLNGIVSVADITFNATSSGLASILGSVNTDTHGLSSLVAGNVDQEVVGSGQRRRRSADDQNRRDLLEVHKQRMRRAVPSATSTCQGDKLPLPGDVNRDCLFDLGDVIFVLRYYSFSIFNFSDATGNLFRQSLPYNKTRDIDVDRNSVVNPADAFYLVRVFLGLVRFVSQVNVIPVQVLSSNCQLSLSVTLTSKNGPASDVNTFVFFDITYRGSAINFAGTGGTQRGVGIYGNLIRGVSRGNGSFGVQAPFVRVQNSIGLSVFHVTIDNNNRTSFTRTAALFGNPHPPYLLPIRLSLDLPVGNQTISVNTNNNYSPFVAFNNTLSSADCTNTFAPQFETIFYHANVSENATVNASVITVNATDLDHGKSGRVSYSLVSAEVLPFVINSTSGVLRVVCCLNREEKARYNVTVRATDGGALGREKFADAYVVVLIIDVNDNAPVVNQIVPSHMIKIPENAALGNPLVRIVGSDEDIGENARISYSFVGNSSANQFLFINATTGLVTLKSSLQGKVGYMFKILVLISDHGIPVLTTNATVEFLVTYASDVNIFFVSQFYAVNLTENSAMNSSVLKVKAYVPGLPDASIFYSLTEEVAFRIDSSDGTILVNFTIDRESIEVYSLTATAEYGHNISTNATVNITVLDENDNAPVPDPVPLQVIPYNLPVGNEMCRVNASDRDDGLNAVLKFSLLGDVFKHFLIDRENGAIFLNSSLLDLKNSFIQLYVEISDSGEPSLTSNLTVNISIQFPPRFSYSVVSINVSEDISIGEQVFTFIPMNISGQGFSTYFIIVDRNYGQKFSISNVSGEVVVQDHLDREEIYFYSLSIHASNLAVERFAEIKTTKLLLNVTVLDINDNAPYLDSIQPIVIRNTAHVGYTLLRLNATDADEGLNAQLQYKITSGNELNKFVINELGFLQLNSSLLYTTVPFFSLVVNVSDHGSPMLFNTTVINVTVEDDRSPPHLNQTFYNVSLYEDSLPGSQLVSVFATDPNGDRIRYNISSTFTNITSVFRVNVSTGIITTVKELDREITDNYKFAIIAYKYSPLTGQQYTDNATISVRVMDVNDARPHFSKEVYTLEFDEENLPGMVFMTINADDNDQGVNSLLSYSIISGNDSIFSINNSTGEISVLTTLDYENVQQLNLTVQAMDLGIPPLEANASVVICIRDINDNAPIIEGNFSGKLNLLESVQQGTSVIRINATDADSGLNSNLSFSIVDGNLSGAFNINPTTGLITTATQLDYEKTRIYTLNVSVHDRGIPPLSNSILVKIQVIDVNDMTPFIHPLSPLYVRESVPVGTMIVRVNATDGDSGTNAALNYTILSGNKAAAFSINETNGVITTAHALDHENVSLYSLNISVNDKGVPPQSSKTRVMIHVVDVNDHRPIFTQDIYQTSLYENLTVNSTVLTVHARDLDVSSAGGIVYSIHESSDNDTFVIGGSTGEIKVIKSLDFEKTKNYHLVVKAIDIFLPNTSLHIIGNVSSSGSFSSFANVTLSVLDVNDNPPIFTNSFYSVLISENLPAGSVVAQVNATDDDFGKNADITYEMLASNQASQLFVINSSTGEVKTKLSLTDANYLTFNLSLFALDMGSPSLNNTGLLQIRINYNVTFKYNETRPFTYAIQGAFQVEPVVMLSCVRAETTLGLFSGLSAELQVSTGSIHYVSELEVFREPALYLKSVIVSDSPDYQVIRVAVQVSDLNFNVRTLSTEVHIRLINLDTYSEENTSCAPSANTGICVGSLHIPLKWLNTSVSSDKVLVEYGLSRSNMTKLKQIDFRKKEVPQVEQNFVIMAPLHLLHVGDSLVLKVYAQYTKLVQFFTLIFTLSSGLKVKQVQASQSWRIQSTFNGENEFVVFGVRKNSRGEKTTSIALFFTIEAEIAENAILSSPEYMECEVRHVSDQEGNQLISVPMSAVFEDGFGRNKKGFFVVVEDDFAALFVVPDLSVIINSAVLNGELVEVPLKVAGVTAKGRVLNVTSVTCKSLDIAVLKVSGDCSSVYVNGSETRGSSSVTVEFYYKNLTANSSFVVWTPIIPITLNVKPAKLKRIRDWYDPSDSCKPRYQQARLTVTANFSNGKRYFTGVDVTQLVKDNFQISNNSVAEIVSLNVHGKSVGKVTVEVYNHRMGRALGEVGVEVLDEDTRVYVLNVVIATRVLVVLPKVLDSSLQHPVRINMEQRFLIPEDEGSVILSAQYSDGVVNTFENLEGFFVNSTNNSLVRVEGDRITAINNSSGNVLRVVAHSGHCSQRPVISLHANLDVIFQEPSAVVVSLSSKEITTRGDSAELIGVPLHTEVRVTLVYNISDRERRLDVSNNNRTIYIIEGEGDLVRIAKTERTVIVSATGGGFGQVQLSILFTHVQSVGHVTIEVIGAQKLISFASPYPLFNFSTLVNVTKLNPIGNSGKHQRVRLNLNLILTNGTSLDVTTNKRTRFKIASTQPAELAQYSSIEASADGYHVVSIRWSGERGRLLISGSFVNLSSHVLILQVESTPTVVKFVEFATSPSVTFRGVRNRSTLQLSVNLGLSDNSKLIGLFRSENTTLFNLVVFRTQDTTKISLNGTSGLVTLRANAPQEVQVTVSALQSPSIISDSISFACNLDPDVGDVDIGDVTGTPLKRARVGESFVAAVRINSGNLVLGSFDIEIVFDDELLEVTSVSEGADMLGFFVADRSSLTDQTGKMRITGALSVDIQTHHMCHVADIKFRVLSSGVAGLRGTVLMVAANNLVGSVIGPPVPRSIVAGNVEVSIDSLGRRRRSLASLFTSSTRIIRSLANCPNGRREPGDADGNCVFDIRDVKFTLDYLTEQQFNFTRVKGQQIQNSIENHQLQSLDANGDGSVTLNDVNLLLRANLKVVPFSPTLIVVPVEDPNSHCLLTISAAISQIGVEPSDANRTFVFFDISHTEQNFSKILSDSVFVSGSLVPTEKGIPGYLIRAEHDYVGRRYVVSLNTSLVHSSVGLSLVQVRFADDGSIDFTRSVMINGLFTRPPLYQGVLNLTLDLGSGRRYSITRPNGYNPYTVFHNALATSNCSDDPLLEKGIMVKAIGARKVVASWKLANARQRLNFSFTLTLWPCDPAQINEPCEIHEFRVAGTNHTLTGLRPYTNYSIQVATSGKPRRETTWTTVLTLETVPEGVDAPTFEIASSSSMNVTWTKPQHPNGIIVSYSLYMSDLSLYSVLYRGLSLSYHVTGLTAGQEYFFFVMANTSVGGTKSTVVSASLPVESTPGSGAGETDLSVGVIVGITIASAAFVTLVIVLLVWIVRKCVERKQHNMLDYQSLHKYNSLDINNGDNVMMQLRSSSSLHHNSLSRGRLYEHHVSTHGLENPWREEETEKESRLDSFTMVNRKHFEPSSARSYPGWDPGYEKTVLKEAAKEMNELDVVMRENLDNEARITVGLRDDNLVRMARQSHSQSSLGPENTAKKTSKKKEEQNRESTEWDYSYAKNAIADGDNGLEDTKSRLHIQKAQLMAEEMLHRLVNGDVNKEFHELSAEKAEGTYLRATDPVNLPKNRYKNILPFDHSSVTLQQVNEGEGESDYINANFLDGNKQRNSYIAAQGPLDKTVAEFWQMVWEQNVHVIVMLTRLQEGKKVKCVKYWPDTDEEVTFKDFVITCTYKRKLDSRVARRFLLENSGSGECRELLYFQFTAWPDFGIPSSPADFLELYYEVMKEYRSLQVPRTPMLVHCSAGVGRSGAFCTINNCLQAFRSTGSIDVAETVRSLRKQRAGMVQTLEQYAFCYKSIILALLYQIKLKKLKGISLLSFSAASSSGVWTLAERSPSPKGTTDESLSPENPISPRSERTKASSQSAPPYSHSQQLFPPLECSECSGDSLPAVIVHSTPKRLLEKQNSFPSNGSKSDSTNSREACMGEKQNLEIPVGDLGGQKMTGNIRKRPNLGEPPPPPPPPPPSRALPLPLPHENHLRDDDSVPELPEVDYSDYEFSEDDDDSFPPPPEAFSVPAEGEQLNQFDSTA